MCVSHDMSLLPELAAKRNELRLPTCRSCRSLADSLLEIGKRHAPADERQPHTSLCIQRS